MNKSKLSCYYFIFLMAFAKMLTAQTLNGVNVNSLPTSNTVGDTDKFPFAKSGKWNTINGAKLKESISPYVAQNPINYLPTPTGNTLNKNTVFRSSVDNNVYYVANTGNAICLSCGQGGSTYYQGDGIVFFGNVISALDQSPTNEIQTLSRQGGTLKLNKPNMASDFVRLPDSSATNELQTISLNNNTLTLSNSGGSVYLGSLVSPTQYRGTHNPSCSCFPTTGGSGNFGTIKAGDFWVFSAAGTMPTGLQPTNIIQAGFLLLSTTDNPGTSATNWSSVSTSHIVYTAGSGISIIGNTIANTGDLSNTNELQTLSLSGNSLTLSNSGGTVTLPTGANYKAGLGINIVNDTIRNTGDLSNTNELQTLSLSGTTLMLSQNGGSVVLPKVSCYPRFNGSELIYETFDRDYNDPNAVSLGAIKLRENISLPGILIDGYSQNGDVIGTFGLDTNYVKSLVQVQGTTYTAGTGISITGTTIANTGDLSNTNELQTLSLSGTTLTLSNSGGSVTLPTGTTYTAGAGVSIAGNTINNTGDLSNTNEIQALSRQGGTLKLTNGTAASTFITLPDSSATNELQTLSLSGTTLTLSNSGGSVTLPTGTTYTAGAGVSIAGNTINNTGDLSNTNEIQALSRQGGTLKLTNGVAASTFIALPDSSASNEIELPTTALVGQVATWNGTNWVALNPAVNNYNAGTGISITGTTIANTGDLSNTNELQTLSLSGTTLTLSNSGGSVTLPAGATYTAGTGINITGSTITNTGDLSSTNEIQTLSISGNIISLTGGGSVTIPSGGVPANSLTSSGNTITSNVNGASSSATIINGTPTMSVSGGQMFFTVNGVNSTSAVIPDPSANNELQTLSLSGNTLTLSQNGGSVTLPSGGSKKSFSPCVSLPTNSAAGTTATVAFWLPTGTYDVYRNPPSWSGFTIGGNGGQQCLSTSGCCCVLTGGGTYQLTITSTGSGTQYGCATFTEQ